jgi:chaperonin cofactor prefoldin
MDIYNTAMTTAPSGLTEIRNPDLIERLEMQKKQLEEGLKEINEALEALKSSPELERIFKLVSKVQFRL